MCQNDLYALPNYNEMSYADDEAFKAACITTCEAMNNMPMDATVGVACTGAMCTVAGATNSTMPLPTAGGMSGCNFNATMNATEPTHPVGCTPAAMCGEPANQGATCNGPACGGPTWERTIGSCRRTDNSYTGSDYEFFDDKEYTVADCQSFCMSRGDCTAIE